MNWIKLLFTQFIFIVVLSNIFALPLLWLSKEKIPYSTAFNLKWKETQKSSFNYPHPYLGYTRTNQNDLSDLNVDDNLIWDSFQTKNYDSSRDPTILIVGGSVAMHISNNQSDHENASSPMHGRHIFSKTILSLYPNAQFRVVNAAYGGKKQPQQYITAVYLDLLGLDYKLVVNIDGFNEIAILMSENSNQGIPAIFPRSYFKQVEAFVDGLKCIETLNADLTFLPFLDFANLVRRQMCLKSVANEDINYRQIFKQKNFQEYMAEAQAIWATSSNKLNSFLYSKKKQYIHVAQPNQYLAGSKPLSNDELKYAYVDQYITDIVNTYYRDLKTDAIESKNFLDLRFVFEKNETTLYRDACCHLNEEGMSIIAQEIVLKNKSLFDKLLFID